jgi:hypothetical protein
MRLTKNDMARVVVQALYNLPSLPAADDKRVLNLINKTLLPRLSEQHKKAVDILMDREADQWRRTQVAS